MTVGAHSEDRRAFSFVLSLSRPAHAPPHPHPKPKACPPPHTLVQPGTPFLAMPKKETSAVVVRWAGKRTAKIGQGFASVDFFPPLPSLCRAH